ncbi:hypothetical protein EDB84DRAFT_1676285 [Lactarius hengduanensis]|nr:hypothetical protein EDB84DRAFT_1676285 [Lactarius hengduanensis]
MSSCGRGEVATGRLRYAWDKKHLPSNRIGKESGLMMEAWKLESLEAPYVMDPKKSPEVLTEMNILGLQIIWCKCRMVLTWVLNEGGSPYWGLISPTLEKWTVRAAWKSNRSAVVRHQITGFWQLGSLQFNSSLGLAKLTKSDGGV